MRTSLEATDSRLLVRTGSLRAWQAAVRPRTLLVAVSPVIVGAALGFVCAGVIDLRAALLVLGAALLVQVATNLQNDLGFTMRGGDASGTRIGLPRASALGWLSVRQLRIAICLVATIAVALGLVLTAYRGWPVLLIGIASLSAALAYMGGPKPIAYTPFGELTVFVFFGLVAVPGTEWVLTGQVNMLGVVSGTAIGLLAAAALAVNNHRDSAHDRMLGRRTFAVWTGTTGSRRLYAALLLGPFLLVPLMAAEARAVAVLLPLALVPTTARLHRDFERSAPGVAFNQILFRTFRLEIWFALLLSAGMLLDKLLISV